ncbi:MAG: hypothetical protein QXL15_04270, partial [Candidatus Korarchaeota archaeon]
MRKTVSLEGTWRLRRLEKDEKIPGVNPEEKSILTTIPGVIQKDIASAMGIENLYFEDNYRKILWVPYERWLLQKKIELPERCEYQELVLDGVDYDCEIWINGKMMSSHKGAFSRVIVPFEYAPTIDLRIKLNPTPLRQNQAVRCQMSYGWDFAPRIICMGIWRGAWIEQSGLPKVRDVHSRLENERTIYEVTLQDAGKGCVLEVELRDSRGATLESRKHNISPFTGTKTIKDNFSIKPEKWYPKLLGDQVLYKIIATTYYNREVMDSIESLVGYRTVERILTPNGRMGDMPWQFIINGERVFLLGSNLVPIDSMYGLITRERYIDVIDTADRIGINIFRVWGGGLIAHDILYEEADRRGIMIWQEFPLACAIYPQTTEFREIVRAEAADSILRLRNHPSVVLLCGGNEIPPKYNKLILDAIKEIRDTFAPHIPFEYASPLAGTIHNWITWHQKAPFEALEIVRMYQLMDEFGFQAFPVMETMKEMMQNPTPNNPMITVHKGELGKLRRYASIGRWKNMEEFVMLSQLAQAIGLQRGIEACRRRKPNVAGVLFWQFNEPWPAVSWAVIDYYMRPKIAYNWLKNLYSPVLPMLTWKRRKNNYLVSVWISSELKKEISGIVEVMSYRSGKLVDSREKNVAGINKYSAMKVWDTDINVNGKGLLKLEVVFSSDAGKFVNWYYPEIYIP